MNSKERERLRWRFAGQAMEIVHSSNPEMYHKYAAEAVAMADALIAALEASAPKQECEHEWSNTADPRYSHISCTKCGGTKP